MSCFINVFAFVFNDLVLHVFIEIRSDPYMKIFVFKFFDWIDPFLKCMIDWPTIKFLIYKTFFLTWKIWFKWSMLIRVAWSKKTITITHFWSSFSIAAINVICFIFDLIFFLFIVFVRLHVDFMCEKPVHRFVVNDQIL